MANPFIGEIRMFAGNFAPAGWMFCEGQILPISEYDTLFTLIGTTYGGDGQTTFQLPDLRGRLPVHFGQGPGLSNHSIGESGGAEVATLTPAHLPFHEHFLLGTTAPATTRNPSDAWYATPEDSLYGLLFSGGTTLAPQAVDPVGGGQPHANVQPFLCISFIIALFGIYPPQS